MTDVTPKQLEAGIRKLKAQLDEIKAGTLSVETTYQLITSMETRLADIQNQFNMFRKVFNVDQEIQQRKKDQDREVFMDVIEHNTDIVNRYLVKLEEQEHPEISYYQAQRQRRMSALKKKLGHIRYLETLRQTKTEEKCHCGQEHYAINFFNKKDELVDTLCPAEWWFNMSQVALEDGNLVTFTTFTPKNNFMKDYNL